MSKVIRFKKGLDINLVGSAEKVLTTAPEAESYAVTPDDFKGVTPKLLVKEGDKVKAGTPLFFDKYRPSILFTAPVSGVVSHVNRGEKRKIEEVIITPQGTHEYEMFNVEGEMSREKIVETLLNSGLWTTIIQRPYGVIALPEDTPRDIFISGFDTAPLAPDVDFVLQNLDDDFFTGIEVAKKLTTGRVMLGISDNSQCKAFGKLKGVEITTFEGPHPAGNVGVQIHHTAPVNKGEKVWTINIQDLVIIGRLFRTGKVDMSKIIAVTGAGIIRPRYVRVISGAKIESLVADNVKKAEEGHSFRYISGNVLTGTTVKADGYITFYANQLTVIPEGDYHEFLGWIAPRFKKFSVSKSYFSWLTPSKKYNLDTNLNGGERALVMTGQYEKVLPMDIYPVYLIKAILAGDIDKMENLGIYEVIEEDLALCEFVCTSKTPVQKILREGINQMIKEC